MSIKNATFIKSSAEANQCPEPDMPEYAFIGRSNVGKSSLINMLCNHKDLAKTSAKPGKTQLINHYLIDKKWYLVDLPGYGYAAVGKEQREKFEAFISDYILTRENLMCLFVLIDARLPMQNIDREFITWLGENEVPFVLVFTKTDKLSTSQLNQNMEAYQQALLNYWEELPTMFLTSAEKKIGAENLIQFVKETNELFQKS